MKRDHAPITAFFERKQVRRHSSNSDNEKCEAIDRFSASSIHQRLGVIEARKADQEHHMSNSQFRQRDAMTRRETREDVTGILQRREIVGCVFRHEIGIRGHDLRQRRKQQLVRWALTHFQRLPLALQLTSLWAQQAGTLSVRTFYTSCLEFDAQGVLLAAGASNGIIALYDFDEVFHRSLNLSQKMENNGEEEIENTVLHPIHTIYTPFEIKCIRWNPLNEDEIACSFTNRNEIYVFNLREFPRNPRKVFKSSNQPSSGYNDLLYLVASDTTVSSTRLLKARPTSRLGNIIAGDTDGAIRMWDFQSPLRPVWSFLAGSVPINALLLSFNNQYLICGNEAGMLMTYDIQRKVVPAFGSKPVPQRKALFNIVKLIKPYLSPTLIESVLLSNHYGSPGIMSMRLVPQSDTQVLCQLRNDWVIVLDYLCGSIVKLHTFIRGSMRKENVKTGVSPSVLSAALTSENQSDNLLRSLRSSWLSCHRCAGTLLFDDSIMCTGIHDATHVNMIDLHQLRRNQWPTLPLKENADEKKAPKLGKYDLQAVERLDRFRIATDSIITAVTAHPNQHAVICGGANMKLQILGVMGQRTPKKESCTNKG